MASFLTAREKPNALDGIGKRGMMSAGGGAASRNKDELIRVFFTVHVTIHKKLYNQFKLFFLLKSSLKYLTNLCPMI